MDNSDQIAAEIITEILAEDSFRNFNSAHDYKGLREEMARWGFYYFKRGEHVLVANTAGTTKEYLAAEWPDLNIYKIVSDFKAMG